MEHLVLSWKRSTRRRGPFRSVRRRGRQRSRGSVYRWWMGSFFIGGDTECLAWSLMSNHFHLLLRPRHTRLGFLMRKLLTGYAIYFNLRHKRSGHLFQNRYKSIVCDEDSYLLELVRYIHLNPQRVGLVRDLAALDTYPWSGHAVIMGKADLEGQVADEVLSMFSNNKREARKKYRAFVSDGIALGKREELGSSRRIDNADDEGKGDEPYDPRILGDGGFVEEIRARHELQTLFSQPLEIKEIVEKICSHFGIDRNALRHRTRAGGVVAARGVICYLAVRVAGYSGVEVGSHVNLRRAGVSVAAERGAKLVEEHPELLRLLDK